MVKYEKREKTDLKVLYKKYFPNTKDVKDKFEKIMQRTQKHLKNSFTQYPAVTQRLFCLCREEQANYLEKRISAHLPEMDRISTMLL